MRWKRVGVLMGGMSAEREISLLSGRAVAQGLRRSGFDVVEIDALRDLDGKLRAADVEAVFIALHGRLGEDGTVQGMLEVMGIPYTGSSVLASALAMDKPKAREVLLAGGLPVTDCVVLTRGAPASIPGDWDLPLVVKPSNEGSSVGVTIVRDKADLDQALEEAFRHSDCIMVERFVSGREITVSLLNGRALGATEIETHREFYDYKAKYDEGGSRHHTPPRISQARLDELMDFAQRAYRALGCSGQARVDFIVPQNAPPVILEVNTVPGMTEVSLVPEVVAYRGMSFEQFVELVMDGATLHCQPR